jgi:signal transduction histidine kinase
VRIRTVMIAAAIALACLIAGAVAALIAVARSGREGAAYIVLSVRSVEVAQKLRLDIGRLQSGEESAAAVDAELDRGLAQAQDIVQSDGEQAVIDRLRAAIAGLRQAEQKSKSELAAKMVVADRAAADLVAINVRQAREAERDVDEGARRGERIAVWAALVLFAGLVGVLAWVRSRLLRPLALLRNQIEEVASGAAPPPPPVAPAEVRAVANALEAMAGALERNQLDRLELLSKMAASIAPPLHKLDRALDALNPGLSPAVPTLASELTRLRGIVEESLDAARIEEGLLELQPEPLDLVALAQESVEFFRQVSPAQIALESPEAAPIAGDSRRLSQALNNLLFVAARHAPVDGRIDVSLSVSDADYLLAIKVSPGNPAGFESLFDALHRLDQATAGVPGSGFTLKTTRRVIAAHGGELEISESQHGAFRFSVRLPRARADQPTTSEQH